VVVDKIGRRFAGNIGRVHALAAIHDGSGSTASTAQGDDADLLRAAVVFLHASLEDLVRSLARRAMPAADATVLKGVPLAGLRRGEKFTLGELARFRGRGVDDVIRESVSAHLSRTSYNDAGELIAALEQLGLDASEAKTRRTELAAMMARRHWIVHRADAAEDGTGLLRPLDRDDVDVWIEAVAATGESLLAAMR